jgi:outer membrane receptor for ferrienterochelin and colicins
MKKTFLLANILIALGTANIAIAEETSDSSEVNQFDDELGDFYGDDYFVSIATGTKKSLDKAPAIASVITAARIEQIGASYLDEILELIPGLHVTPSTVSRLDPVYSIRGIQTGFNPQVLVLVNGTEFKNSFSGGLPYTFRLPAKNIERIEVIRGPGSALYGADAYSGVINVVLKKQHETEELNVGGRLGSFNSRDIWLQAGKKIGDFSFGFALENQRSDGDDNRLAETDLQSVFDSVFGTNASNAPSSLQSNYDVLDIHATLAYKDFTWENWWWQQDKGGVGPGGAQALDTDGYQNVDEFRSTLSYATSIDKSLNIDAKASYLKVENDSYFVLFPAGAVLPIGADGNINFSNIAGIVNFTDGYIGNPQSKHQDFRVDIGLNYTGFADHEIRTAFGWFKQDHKASEFKNFGPGIIDGSQAVVDGQLTDVSGTPYIFVPDVSRTNRHIVIQDIWAFAQDWELTTGIRYDDFSDFGNTVNPRLALVWEAARDLTLKALYGSAFRAPSFNEQFLQNNPSALGNPNIKPETIDTFELGMTYQLSFKSKLAANIYSFKADDLISKAPVPGTTSLRTENLSSQKGIGAEVEFSWKSNDIEFETNVSIQDTKDVDTDEQIALVPTKTALFALHYDATESLKLAAVSHWISGRERAASDNRETIDDYWLVNLSAGYQLTNNLKSNLSIKNVFDEKIYEPSTGSISNDYRMPGRSLWLELEYK